MAKKLTEKELIDLLANYILKNSSEMISLNPYERSILKLEEISELVMKEIKEKLKELK